MPCSGKASWSTRGGGYVVAKKSGTQLTTKGEKLDLEAALAQHDGDVELQLRYDTFVLFDAGDLEEAAERIASLITG